MPEFKLFVLTVSKIASKWILSAFFSLAIISSVANATAKSFSYSVVNLILVGKCSFSAFIHVAFNLFNVYS